MQSVRYLRTTCTALLLVVVVADFHGCARQPTEAPNAAGESPELIALRAADRTERANYERAASNTKDGTRAYKHEWGGYQSWSRSGWLAIIVSPDGQATLIGSIPKPVPLTQTEVSEFERYVAETEFPKFPRVQDVICNDGFFGAFEVAMNGQRTTAISNNCGAFGAHVAKATGELWRLAEKNGGVSMLPREIPTIPIAISAFQSP